MLWETTTTGTSDSLSFTGNEKIVTGTSAQIEEICDTIKAFLIDKNAAYGDSALAPANIFASGSAVENLCCRIDDKLMRIKNKGITDKTEDTIDDLIGYLILLKIALR